MTRAVIVENGGANVASLRYALERQGVAAEVSSDPAVVRAASHVFLPGVGAAGDAMRRLEAAGLAEAIPRLTQPVLGICLGMQLLYESSEEQGTACLGVLAGRVRRIEPAPGRVVPHMGWSRIRPSKPNALTDGVDAGDWAYFVHSFAAPPGPETVAVSEHGGPFSAIVSHGNFHGTQFHPERSAATGARVLANFLRLDGWN